ncbi:sulfotransferase 1C2 isoform X1 [Dermacentor silvarum]|uniref:sulfotransferase 1C2 isoform X1 n=1 Tax=Dermacentor silvarum TaxID=543639 RepID=UPI0021014950|nr:sulfotransferase 1C2 isoform X1 [Dermacentor silvarum]XP_049521846.1 sulfotransferase 1C2 isoform X1 [Dermacentor silvarum]XP_049521847.1 sulfotransferase 1C2 isoform X1 [Dermacentor silvarum]XP_049521848.1 sulfotransferase 1C2 isoform X1 [Dermacentor silvarum]
MAASNVSCSTQTSGNAWRLRHFEGILFGDTFDESRIRSAIQYEPRAGDVFVVGFPKTGTTWLHFTVRHLLNKDDETPLESAAACMPRVSFLEIAGAENVESQRRPGAVIKTHLPFENVRFSEKARYIYVLRNPYDTCVSYYHHMRRNSSDLSDMSFDDFFDQFIDGYVHPNDYFDHLTSWLAQTSKANFLFIAYEDIKRDPRSSILRIAAFLDKRLEMTLSKDEAVLDAFLQTTSADVMKAIFRDAYAARQRDMASGCSHSKSANHNQITSPCEPDERASGRNIVRKAVVGDWKNYFSASQTERMKAKMASKTVALKQLLDVLWKNADLP